MSFPERLEAAKGEAIPSIERRSRFDARCVVGGNGLGFVPRYVYAASVKRQELESALRALGWRFLKHGGSHDLWAHPERSRKLAVPRHKEINEFLARSLLRQAELTD